MRLFSPLSDFGIPLERWLHDGAVLLLLDGLDEVNSRREGIIEEIKQVARRHGNCPVLLTCRIAAAEYTFEHFRYLEMADFVPEQVAAFVRSWFRDAAMGPAGDNDSLAETMLKELGQKEYEGIRELASSPLLLTLLCLAYQETLRFPARRVEIYEEALEALLKKWDSSRQIRRNSAYGQLSLGRKRQMLTRIAYETFVAGEYFVPQRQLEAHLKGYLIHVPEMPEAVDIEPEKVLTDIIAQHGLFVERAHQIFSFSHLTFQEYFVAKHIVDNANGGTLAEMVHYASEERWREVFLLVASLLPAGEPLFTHLLPALAQPIVRNPQLVVLLHQANGATLYQSLVGRQPAAIRTGYLFLALVLARAHDLAPILALDLDLAFELALAFSLDLARALALALDLASAHDLALARGEDLDLWLDIGLVSYLNEVRVIAAYSTERRERMTNVLPGLQQSLTTVAVMATRLRLPTIAAVLRQHPWSAASAPNSNWEAFANRLEQILSQQRGFNPDLQLSNAQWEVLRDYLQGNRLLLDCLNLAYVQDRAAIEDQMLLPPSP
ncbi:MAG: NACHT domain-containing protein [Anaerolineales bacterium]|nr:NACHT domain-containing protein [Anaerolineales bacterium]